MPNSSPGVEGCHRPRRLPVVGAVLAPAGASLAVLAPVLAAPFFWDDHVFLLLARETPLSLVLGRGLLRVYFRPLGELLVWLVARLPGDGPVPCHALSAALVAVSAGLAALLVRRWTRDGGAAVVAGLLAGVAPTAVVSGAWLANIFSTASVALGLAAMATAARPTLAVGLALAAVLAKEDGVLWLPGVLFLIHAESRGKARRTGWSTLLAVAGLGAIAAWRHGVLGGAGGVVPISRLLDNLPGGPFTAVLAAAVTVALILLVRPPLVRAALPLAAGGAGLGLALSRSLPLDPHRLWLRFFIPGAAGGALLAGCALAAAAASARWVRGLGTAVVILCAVVSLGWERHWMAVTGASRRMVESTISALDAHPAIHGPVWVEGPGDEIALAAAVGRVRGDLLERAVPLRREGINLVVCPRRLWRRVRPVLALSPLAGNPSRVAGWMVAVGFPRPAVPGVPVVHVGGGNVVALTGTLPRHTAGAGGRP